jgi:hypothetical protein
VKIQFLALLGTALLASSVPAHSAPITYRFKVNGGYAGPLAGQTAAGSLTFDSSIVPPGGGALAQTGLLTDLSFTWDGVAYNDLTANTGSMDFSSTGRLESVIFGDDCNAGTCRADYGTAEWYIWFQLYNDYPNYFVYGIPGYFSPPGLFHGTAFIREPDSFALFGIGLVSLLFLVRPKGKSRNFGLSPIARNRREAAQHIGRSGRLPGLREFRHATRRGSLRPACGE